MKTLLFILSLMLIAPETKMITPPGSPRGQSPKPKPALHQRRNSTGATPERLKFARIIPIDIEIPTDTGAGSGSSRSPSSTSTPSGAFSGSPGRRNQRYLKPKTVAPHFRRLRDLWTSSPSSSRSSSPSSESGAGSGSSTDASPDRSKTDKKGWFFNDPRVPTAQFSGSPGRTRLFQARKQPKATSSLP